jgi:hypothetical protein
MHFRRMNVAIYNGDMPILLRVVMALLSFTHQVAMVGNHMSRDKHQRGEA